MQTHGQPVGLMDLFVHGTEDALPDDGRVDRAPIAGAAALFMLQKPGEPLHARTLPGTAAVTRWCSCMCRSLGEVRQPPDGQRGRAGRHHGRSA